MELSPEDAKDRLERIAAQLRSVRFPSEIDEDLAQWLANGLTDFLDRSIPLERALGLTNNEGAKANDRRNQLIAQEIVEAGEDSATYADIAQRLARRYPREFKNSLDGKQISRVKGNSKYMDKARGEEIERRLNAKDALREGHYPT